MDAVVVKYKVIETIVSIMNNRTAKRTCCGDRLNTTFRW